jgi:HK97 family phage prohead protease
LEKKKTINFSEKPEVIIPFTFRELTSEEVQERTLGDDSELGFAPSRFIEGVATVAGIDDNDVEVTPAALRAAQNDLLQRSTILENHDITRPIGRVLDSKFDPATKSLLITGFISETEDVVWRKVKEGVLSKFSISWRSLDFETVFDEVTRKSKLVVHDMRIFEVSVVAVPAIAEADLTGWVERTLRDHTSDMNRAAPYSSPHVVPFKRATAASKNRRWDAPSAIRRLRRRAGGLRKETIDWSIYAEGFAYVEVDGTSFGDYKFPLRDVRGGKLIAVFRAAANAASRLPNSNLPEEDKRAVARRLVREYKEIHKVSDDEIPENLLSLAGKKN